MKMILSLIVWAVLWEIAGRLKLSTIVPPFSAVIEASKQRSAAAIFLVVPAHDAGGLPLINQELPIRGVLPSDGLWVSPHWLANKHNAAA